MNQINLIKPYKHHGHWVFDDAPRGLIREPFVSGADVILDKLSAEFPDPDRGFTVLFSEHQFPGANHILHRRGKDAGGWWYEHLELRQTGWLCPAMFKYFVNPPAEIYLAVTPLKSR